MRIVIELKREAVPKVVLNNLYKHTQMQQSFGVNLVALVDGVPRTLSYREVLKHYVAHQFEVVTRRTRYELERAKARRTSSKGCSARQPGRGGLDHPQEPQRGDRAQEPDEDLQALRAAGAGYPGPQAAASHGAGAAEGRAGARDFVEKIEYLESVLADESKIYEIIKEELLEVRAAYADERRTRSPSRRAPTSR